MRTQFLVLGATICVITGCNSRTDSEKLQGAWQLHSMAGEFRLDLRGSKGMRLGVSFAGEQFTFENLDQEVRGRRHTKLTGVFSCDSTARPKQITFNFDDGRTVVGIFDFSWDTLRICVGEEDDVPPTEFAGGAPQFRGSRPALLIFERLPDQ
jgi:uncharacterized protein (TIGR03067 family)